MAMNGSPVRTETFEKEIGGKRTQFIATKFSNYTFIIVTQTGKIGILARISPQVTEEQSISGAKGTLIEVKILQGPDEPLTTAVTRSLIGKGEPPKTPLLIGFSLDMNLETASAVGEALRAHKLIY